MAPWLGSFPSKSLLKRIKQIDRMYSILHKDIELLKRHLAAIKKRESFLFSEAQHHQLQLLKESLNKKILSNTKVANLKDVYMDVLSKKLETQQMVSLSGVTNVKLRVKHVAGFKEKVELSPLPRRRKRRRRKPEVELEDDVQRQKGVFRLFQVQGTIGDVAYTTVFIAKRKVGQEHGKAMKLIHVKLGTQSSIPKQMLTPVRLNLPETICCVTNDLYYYKLLQDERQEALEQIESEVPGLEALEHSEPVVMHLLSRGHLEVEVVWGLHWDELNCIFKYNISLNCSDEVITRFSRSEVYQYLSGRRKLKTQEEVIAFAEVFSEL